MISRGLRLVEAWQHMHMQLRGEDGGWRIELDTPTYQPGSGNSDKKDTL